VQRGLNLPSRTSLHVCRAALEAVTEACMLAAYEYCVYVWVYVLVAQAQSCVVPVMCAARRTY
jgi:hypothetical protein